jgi:hypothetical protein
VACAAGEDWRPVVAEAERKALQNPGRVLTRSALKRSKGIDYSRSHLHRRINAGTFPRPYQMPVEDAA